MDGIGCIPVLYRELENVIRLVNSYVNIYKHCDVLPEFQTAKQCLAFVIRIFAVALWWACYCSPLRKNGQLWNQSSEGREGARSHLGQHLEHGSEPEQHD